MYKVGLKIKGKPAILSPKATQEVTERQLRYAVDAGLKTAREQVVKALGTGGHGGGPISDTGHLARSIVDTGALKRGGQITGQVYVQPSALYWLPIEFGRKAAPVPLVPDPFPIPKRARKFSNRMVPILIDWVQHRFPGRSHRDWRSLAYVIARKIKKTGFKGTKFAERGHTAAGQKIDRIFRSVGLEVANELVRG